MNRVFKVTQTSNCVNCFLLTAELHLGDALMTCMKQNIRVSYLFILRLSEQKDISVLVRHPLVLTKTDSASIITEKKAASADQSGSAVPSMVSW